MSHLRGRLRPEAESKGGWSYSLLQLDFGRQLRSLKRLAGLAGAAAGLAEVTAADLLVDHWFSNSLERTAAPTRSHPRRLQTQPKPQRRPPLFPKTRSAPGSWWLAVRKANAAIMVIRTHYSGRKGITGDRSPL